MQTSEHKRILVVTHQLPWHYQVDTTAEGTRTFIFTQKSGHSAQTAGARSLEAVDQTVISIGWIGQDVDEQILPDLKKALYEQKSCILVDLPHDVAHGHYEGYCKTGSSFS